MKRVKIMLTAIGVFAVVGGALAINANTFGIDTYCYRDNDTGTTCTSIALQSQFKASGGFQYKYLKTSNSSNCVNNSLTCSVVGRINS